MPVRRKTSHIRANDGNDGLCAGIPYTSHILDGMGSLFFLRFHEAVNLIIQIFDVDIKLVQVRQELLHHPTLERAHHTIEVVYDLLLGGLEIMGDDFLFIHLIIFRSIHGRAGEKILQDVARALAVDIRHGTGQLDVGALQHLLEAVELPGAFTDKALAVTDQLTQFPLLFIRDVTGLEQPMLKKIRNLSSPITIGRFMSIPFAASSFSCSSSLIDGSLTFTAFLCKLIHWY